MSCDLSTEINLSIKNLNLSTEFLLACGHCLPYVVKLYRNVSNRNIWFLSREEWKLIGSQIEDIRKNFYSIKSMYKSDYDQICTNCNFHEEEARKGLVALHYRIEEERNKYFK